MHEKRQFNNMRSVRGDECTIQVSEEDWVSQMGEELKEMSQNCSQESKRWEAMSIYRIPLGLKNLCKDAYKPQMVAIGPYHHGDDELKGMEEHKKRALRKFLERSDKPLDYFVNALTPLLQDLKNAYHHLQPSPDFLKLMLLDGCFILELMRTSTHADHYASAYARNDPIFSNLAHLNFEAYLKRDMLMLENQIPLLVLIKLVDAEASWKQDELTKCILKFFDRLHQIKNIEQQLQKFGKCLHILDLYRKSLLSLEETTQRKLKAGSRCGEMVWSVMNGECIPINIDGRKKKDEQHSMRSATELTEAGIRFGKSGTTNLDDISFNGGELKLPRITVDDATKSLYLNLMALERFRVDAGNQVTSYVFFMDRLIDNARDVGLLHWGGIMENQLGSDQVVAEMFNSLSTDICLHPESEFESVQKRVVEYYRMRLPRCMAFAKHTYFTNPWVSLSIVGALLLFALTIIQTVYAILDYNKP